MSAWEKSAAGLMTEREVLCIHFLALQNKSFPKYLPCSLSPLEKPSYKDKNQWSKNLQLRLLRIVVHALLELGVKEIFMVSPDPQLACGKGSGYLQAGA